MAPIDTGAALVVGLIVGAGTAALALVLVADRVARACVNSAKLVVLAKRTPKRGKVKVAK